MPLPVPSPMPWHPGTYFWVPGTATCSKGGNMGKESMCFIQEAWPGRPSCLGGPAVWEALGL